MNVYSYITALAQYGLSKELYEPCDRVFIINHLLPLLGLDHYETAEARPMPLEEILLNLMDYAVRSGLIDDDITSRDLFDTKLMGVLTPPPREVRKKFNEMYKRSPKRRAYTPLKIRRTHGYVASCCCVTQKEFWQK